MLNVKNMNLHFHEYSGCRGSLTSCTFIDPRQNSLEINSETLYLMFRFMKRELERHGDWDILEDKVLSKYPGMDKIKTL